MLVHPGCVTNDMTMPCMDFAVCYEPCAERTVGCSIGSGTRGNASGKEAAVKFFRGMEDPRRQEAVELNIAMYTIYTFLDGRVGFNHGDLPRSSKTLYLRKPTLNKEKPF